MSAKSRTLHFISRRHLLIAYISFTIVIGLGFAHIQGLQKDLERESIARTHVLCTSQNQLKTTLGQILDGLAAERPNDEPGEFEERAEVREGLEGLLSLDECPPPPS